MSNYPPGVTGNEPQIAGSSWEAWIESVKPGDPIWHVDGRQGVLVRMDEIGAYVRVDGREPWWLLQDLMQPDTKFYLWAAAQGEGE